MTPQEIEQKVIDIMSNMQPVEATIVDNHIRYASTIVTHNAYKAQLINAKRGTRVYKTYLKRCYEWIRLLKKENVEIINQIKK
jgi:hypothetical protein